MPGFVRGIIEGIRRFRLRGQIPERFDKAMQLLDFNAWDVKLEAIHDLGEVAKDSNKYLPKVLTTLAEFIRTNAPYDSVKPDTTPLPEEVRDCVQAALDIIGQRKIDDGKIHQFSNTTSRLSVPKDKEESDKKFLRIDLNRTNLQGMRFKGNFTYVHFDDSYMAEADFTNAVCYKSFFNEANLQGANFYNSFLFPEPYADVWTSANLTHANLQKAFLEHSIFISTDLTNADLTNARLKDVWLLDCNLDGANLSGADLTDSKYNQRTTLPKDFNPEEHGMKFHHTDYAVTKSTTTAVVAVDKPQRNHAVTLAKADAADDD